MPKTMQAQFQPKTLIVGAVVIVGVLLLLATHPKMAAPASHVAPMMPQYEAMHAGGEAMMDAGVEMAAMPQARMMKSRGSRPHAGRAPPQKPRVATSAHMASRVDFDNWTRARNEVRAAIADYGVLEQNVNERERQGTSGAPSFLRVDLAAPADNFTSFTAALKRIGEVYDFTINKVVVDRPAESLAVQLELAEANAARLRKLLDDARTVQEKLEVNRVLYDAEREAAVLREQSKTLDDAVERVRLHYELHENHRRVPREPEDHTPWLVVAVVAGLLVLGLGVIPRVLQGGPNA